MKMRKAECALVTELFSKTQKLFRVEVFVMLVIVGGISVGMELGFLRGKGGFNIRRNLRQTVALFSCSQHPGHQVVPCRYIGFEYVKISRSVQTYKRPIL